MVSADDRLKISMASLTPMLLLLPDEPRFTIVEANPAYLNIIGKTEELLVGKSCFDIFDACDVDAASVFQTNLRESLVKVMGTRLPDTMITQNYGILPAGTDKFEIRYCEQENIPVLDPDKAVKYIIHNVQDRIDRQLSPLMNDAEDSFILLDTSLRIILFNKQFHRLYKDYFHKDVEKGESILSYAQPERLVVLKELYGRVLDGNNEKFEIDVVIENGTIKSFLIKYSPAKDENSQIIGVFITISEITAEKESKNNQAALIDNTDDLIWSVTRELKLIAANRAFTRRMEAMLGKTLRPGDKVMYWDAFEPGFVNMWQLYYQRGLSGESFKEEIHLPAGNGIEESWAETKFNPIHNKGAITGLACYSRDITERKIIELKIAREKNLSDSVIKALPGIFLLFSKTGHFIRWNQNFETAAGYAPEDIRSMRPPDFFNSEEPQGVAEQIENAFIMGANHIKAFLVSKTGGRRPYYLTLISIDYEGSTCQMLLGRDLTESIEAEEKLKRSSDRSLQLAANLQIAKEEERQRIGREIHDDLGQQLTAIHMDVAWVTKHLPEETTLIREKLANIRQLLNESNQSVRRILSELRPDILEDYDLVDALVLLGDQFTKNTGIPVIFTTSGTRIKSAEEVAACIYRVYQEALTNITRHSSATLVHASISTAGAVITVIIEDNGIGFDPSASSAKPSFGLLGMRERVVSLGGTYEMKSSIGYGTEVMIQLQATGTNVRSTGNT